MLIFIPVLSVSPYFHFASEKREEKGTFLFFVLDCGDYDVL